MGLPDSPNGKEVVAPSSRMEWREWLRVNQDRDEGAWVLVPRKAASVVGPSYEDLVEEALCFGWIDGQAAKGDESYTLGWFSPRRRGGIWARSNKERVARLEAAGLIAERGASVIAAAKSDGSWAQYDDADALVVHDDLAAALAATPRARDAFNSLAPSHRKQHLWYVYEAKRPETRERRIAETVERLLE